VTKKTLSLALAVCLALAAAPAARAAGPVDAQTAYGLAKATAVKWQPDAELFDFGTLSTGPLDGEGRSAEWNIKWSSKKAAKVNLMSVTNGAVKPFETPGAGGRAIVLSPESIFDSKKLLSMADAAGGAAHRAKGAVVSLGLVENRVVHGPLWHVSYSGKDGKEVFHVGIEANGGKTKVLSD
jgi:hypothetical protein